jgi:hypothetical protein
VQEQLDDLAAIGLDWDGEVLVQSERTALYEQALERLPVYECFCTRAEIREAASAAHGPVDSYPGTCRHLTDAERKAKRADRDPALRVNAGAARIDFDDRLLGPQTGVVDDFVVRRNDGAFAYNLAVVVDDVAQGIGEVVRGADLVDSTPRQIWLARALGHLSPPSPTSRSCSARTGGGWPSGTATSPCARSIRPTPWPGWRARSASGRRPPPPIYSTGSTRRRFPANRPPIAHRMRAAWSAARTSEPA